MDSYTLPPPELSPGFEWDDTYNELLQQIAATNVVDADWPVLRDMLKYKLAVTITDYLSSGPPYPLAPEAAYEARTGAYEALDMFQGPPFTIQRICELILHPRAHYTSLPKYLRALNRATSVSSDRSAFTEDDSLDFSYASTSATTLDSSAPVLLSSAIGSSSGPIQTRRPAVGRSPLSSPRALPVVVPLLSPISWLSHTDEDDLDSVEDMDLSAGVRAVSNGNHTSPPKVFAPAMPPCSSATATPTGGLVDEVDPGSGTDETLPPVALTHSAERDMEEREEVASLRERFVRASSPRKDEEEEREGVIGDVGAGMEVGEG